MAHFTEKLVLGRWMLEQFGVETLETFKGLLSDANLVGFDEENTSLFHHELINKPFRTRAMSDDTLRLYDDNIVRHWRRITERRNQCQSPSKIDQSSTSNFFQLNERLRGSDWPVCVA